METSVGEVAEHGEGFIPRAGRRHQGRGAPPGWWRSMERASSSESGSAGYVEPDGKNARSRDKARVSFFYSENEEKGACKKLIIDDKGEKLVGLMGKLGEARCTRPWLMLEINEYNASGNYLISELWNNREN